MSDKLRILIVDDDRRMAKTLLDILEVEGYESEAACSGAEALDMVKKGHFDCVLTDIKMPEVNGVELSRAIKAIQPELPVVLMTAYSELVEERLEENAIATAKMEVKSQLGGHKSDRQARVKKLYARPQADKARLSCGKFQTKESICTTLTEQLIAAESIGEKAAWTEGLIEVAEELLACEEYEKASLQCQYCRTLSLLRKKTGALIVNTASPGG